ncbi:MAG: GtrA family protein [Actinomycetia bacterium]|nr:GtrA family protein [Actinomycetes bacterium]
MELPEGLRTLIRRFEEQLRFLIVGLVNTAFNYGLFTLLLWVLAPEVSLLAATRLSLLRLAGRHSYAVVQWIAWVLSVPVSTYTMRRFVFRRDGSYPAQVLRAYGVYLPAQLIASGVLIFCVQVLRFPALLGQLVAVCFSTVVSYLGLKFFTFRVQSSD